jgi:2-keto-3-deoxy-L-fuconate dehydrogenase
MTDRLKGKIAFCTASGAGIGQATALAFHREGARVIATDIDEASLRVLANAGIKELHKLDVTRTADVEAMAKKVGQIDVLFNAAGYVAAGSVLECSDTDWDFSFDLNVRSMHRTIKAFLPGMLERGTKSTGGSSIVNIASGAGSVRGIPNRYVYGTTKAAVIGLSKAVAADFIRKGVRCNAICPGTVQSPSLDARIAAQSKALSKSEADVRQMFVDRQPMGRLGTAEEIAAIAVYLASEESAFTTGQNFLVDGGFAL